MKKKNSVYFIVPIVGLALFFAGYWRFLADHKVKTEMREADAKQKVADKQKKIQADNDLAFEQEKINIEKKNAATKARAEKKAADQDYRTALNSQNRKLQSDAQRLTQQLVNVNRDVDEAKKDLETIEAKRQKAAGDAAHYAELAKQAEATRQGYQAELQKIVDADMAIRAAAAAAQAQANANK